MTDYTLLKEAMQEMNTAEVKILAQKMIDYREGFKAIERPAISKYFGQLAALLMMEEMDRKKAAKLNTAALLGLETNWSDTGKGEKMTIEDLADKDPATFEKFCKAYDALSAELQEALIADEK
jgi:succinylarginine dihydrolase